MSVQPDNYLPATWSLDSSNVQAIETSQTDPKVRMDSSGLYVTDASGRKLTYLHAQGGAVDLAAYTSATPPDDRKIRWYNENGTPVASIATRSFSVGTDPAGHIEIFGESQLNASASSGEFGAISANAIKASIYANAPSNAGGASVAVQAGPAAGVPYFERLLDAGNFSDYLRGGHIRRMIGGNPFSGVGFTTNRPMNNNNLIIVGLTGYINSSPVQVRVDFYIDGVNVGFTTCVFNEINSHRTFPVAFCNSLGLAAGNHSFVAVPNTGQYVFDGSDYFAAAIIA